MAPDQPFSFCSSLHVLPNRITFISPSEFKNMEKHLVCNRRLLILVDRGKLGLRINGKDYEMTPCSFLDLLNWGGVEFTRISPDLEAYCLLPTYEFTNESVNGLKPGPENYFQERLYRPIVYLFEHESKQLRHRLEEMDTALSDREHFYRKERVQTHFKLFLLELGNIMLTHQKESKKSVGSIGKSDIIMTGFLRLVWKNFLTEHNLAFYADKLNISTKHLSRTVKKMLGKTPYEVISDELLQHAMTLLKNNELSITEISASLRFSEQAAFYKFFKKHTGMSPGEYRKNNA